MRDGKLLQSSVCEWGCCWCCDSLGCCS
ncbi:hypothetical protein E2C01_096899 [Portunus trituberculatus]|uniref:Uncharacterized protein n=1 Tax=Portunus trituberculatus TaxID=210409 RepID=A0A5B7K389_PORTR|nr:hypothetical protein [Portunus trituberculatus]